MPWIKLQIHPEHHKILVLSDLTGSTPEDVFACVVRWFWHLDSHYAEGRKLAVSETSFHRITRWSGRKSLAAAMCSEQVRWLEQAPENLLQPTAPEAHFSASAKSRALSGERVSAHRERRNGDVTLGALQKRYLEEEKEKEKDKSRRRPTPAPVAQTKSPPNEPAAAAAIAILREAGLGAQDAARLAAHPNATPERLEWLLRRRRHGESTQIVAAGILQGWEVPADADPIAAKVEAAMSTGMKRASA